MPTRRLVDDNYPGAVDEMLRFESSVTVVPRNVVVPHAIGDTVVPFGDLIFFITGAANRDPAAFFDPDRFVITRCPHPHLAFGAGIHCCVGAPLPRMAAEVALGQLLRQRPVLALARPTEPPARRKLIKLQELEMLEMLELRNAA